jgi:hypothetical protein
MVAGAILLVLGAVGCGADAASPVASSSVPPDDLPACDTIYKEGVKIEDSKFALACVKNDQVVSPVPVALECSDERQLRYNDLAWGYVGEGMTLIAEDDPSKVPEEAVNACLAPGPDGEPPDQS